MKLEDTLNGGYNGLYAEVVTHDCYKLRQLDFTPDLVFDIGANVGVFTRFARSLWPDATIIAIEPHLPNMQDLIKFTAKDDNIQPLYMALGKTGQLWRAKGARNGSGESYISSGLGFDEATMETAPNMNRVNSVSTIMLSDLVRLFYKENKKTVMKIDCEGGENVIWEDEPSMESLRKMDYICMETHFYALQGGQMYDEMKEKTLAALKSLEDTHVCFFEHPHFQARKR